MAVSLAATPKTNEINLPNDKARFANTMAGQWHLYFGDGMIANEKGSILLRKIAQSNTHHREALTTETNHNEVRDLNLGVTEATVDDKNSTIRNLRIGLGATAATAVTIIILLIVYR